MKALIPSKLIAPEFLYYVLKGSEKKLLGKINKGATVHRLQSAFLQNLVIPIPSINEQQSIVTKLDVLSKQIKKLEEIYTQKLASLDELKKSILQKAFEGAL